MNFLQLLRFSRKNKKPGFSMDSLIKGQGSLWEKKAFIFNDTRPDQHFGCDCVMENLLCIIDKCGLSSHYLYAVGKNWEQDERVPAKVAECDVIIVNGEGSIHHSNRRARSLSRVGRLARNLNKPVILLNSTLFENNKRVYKNLSYFDLIFGRDSYSILEAGEHGLKISYAPDLTFYSDFGFLGNRSKDDNLKVLVGDSVVIEAKDALNLFAEKYGYCRVEVVYGNSKKASLHEHINKMKKAKLVVTGRFHTVCFCLNAGIPFVAIESNTKKISSLLDDCFQNRQRLIQPGELDSIDISEFSNFSNQEVADIYDFKQRAHESFEILGRKLKSLL